MRRAIGRAMLVAIGCAMAWSLGELALYLADRPARRPFLQEFRGDRFKLMAYDSNPTGAFDLDLRDEDLRRRLAARLFDPAAFESDWSDTPYAVAFELNARGYRERLLTPKPPGVRRIVIVGDSFTAGHGLPNALAYPRLLEARLQRSADHASGSDPLASAVEVLNLGRGDTDLPAILASADFALRALTPDVLVYGYFLNDAAPSVRDAAGDPTHDMLDAGWLAAEQTASTIRIGAREPGPSRVLDLVRQLAEDRRVTTATIAWYRTLHAPDRWRPVASRLAALDRAARAQKARFILALLPLPFEIADSPFAEAHRDMVAAAEAEGIEVLDLMPTLAGEADADLRLHPRDLHPSPLYARFVAERLSEVLAPGGESSPR